MKKFFSSQQGYVIALVLIFLVTSTFLAVTLFARVGGFVLQTRVSSAREQATNVAEAGIDYAVWQLNEVSGTPATDPVAVRVGVGEFKTKVEASPTTFGNKLITSTGCVPSCQDAKKQTRVIKVEVESGLQISFPYALQADSGGIIPEAATGRDESRVIGNVYSNWDMECNRRSVCFIDGNGWTAGRNREWRASGTITENAPQKPLPFIDLDYWKAKAAAGGTTVCRETCTFEAEDYDSGDPLTTIEIGPKKFIGDVLISEGVKLVIKGPIYITGSLSAKGKDSEEIVLDESFGSNSTLVIADDDIELAGIKVLPTSKKGFLIFASTSTREKSIRIDDYARTDSLLNAILYAPSSGVEFNDDEDDEVGPFEEIKGAIAAKTMIYDRYGADIAYDPNVSLITFPPDPLFWHIKRGTYRFAN